ncbi:DUF3107 domain-containing protein [Planctomonas sp. JC2975]|uniref:DUF3107 family protein n=1 Tax=Planctomonas sp. JC2975 TaxID=2729626 RepID=UPI00147352DC|nr:DUF3107 domain-containing protein [Planctomonas sp. JC2975]
MEIRIGIVNAPRELSFESTQSASEIESAVSAALSGDSATLELRDEHGSLFIVPTAGIAYVQVGSEESRRVGFVA